MKKEIEETNLDIAEDWRSYEVALILNTYDKKIQDLIQECFHRHNFKSFRLPGIVISLNFIQPRKSQKERQLFA
jgi:hypothetical protein